jgi:hypothetical protein
MRGRLDGRGARRHSSAAARLQLVGGRAPGTWNCMPEAPRGKVVCGLLGPPSSSGYVGWCSGGVRGGAAGGACSCAGSPARGWGWWACGSLCLRTSMAGGQRRRLGSCGGGDGSSAAAASRAGACWESALMAAGLAAGARQAGRSDPSRRSIWGGGWLRGVGGGAAASAGGRTAASSIDRLRGLWMRARSPSRLRRGGSEGRHGVTARGARCLNTAA